MKIPHGIKIGGHWIPIEVVTSKDIDNEGEYNHYHRFIRIRIDRDIREDIISETLQHEIFEAIKHINQLELSHSTLTVLSEVFFQVVRDNKLNFADTEAE